MIKYLIFLLISISLTVPNSVYAEKALKIGYVNMNKAINLSNEGKRSKKFLEAQAKQTQKLLKTKEQELIIKEKELKENILLNQETKTKKQLEIVKLRQELRREITKAQSNLRKDEVRHTSKIFKDLVTIVNKIAEEEEFDLILEYNLKQTILFSRYEMLDITDKLTETYNKIQSLK